MTFNWIPYEYRRRTLGMLAGLVVGAAVAIALTLTFRHLEWEGGGVVAIILGLMSAYPVFHRVTRET